MKPLDGSGYENMQEVLADTSDFILIKEGWNRPYRKGQKKSERNINQDWNESPEWRKKNAK
jgi:hypothetical protein